MVSPTARKQVVGHLIRCGYSKRRACRVTSVSRSTLGKTEEAKAERDKEIVERIRAVAKKHPRYGCPRVHAQLRRDGLLVNKKRVHRLWKQEGLNRRKKPPRKRIYGTSEARAHKAEHPNHVWTYDFTEDRTENGNRLRILSIVDEFTRECLTLRVEKSFSAAKVLETLEFVFLLHGTPRYIRSDNGPEFIAGILKDWLKEKAVGPVYVEPGSPWQNGYVESFHDKFRDECLNREVFASGREARVLIEAWRDYYNTERLHSSLGYKTPAEFTAQWHGEHEVVEGTGYELVDSLIMFGTGTQPSDTILGTLASVAPISDQTKTIIQQDRLAAEISQP